MKYKNNDFVFFHVCVRPCEIYVLLLIFFHGFMFQNNITLSLWKLSSPSSFIFFSSFRFQISSYISTHVVFRKLNSPRVQLIIRSFLFKFLFLSSKKKNIFLNHESKKKKKKWCFICINHEWMKFSLFLLSTLSNFIGVCVRVRSLFAGIKVFKRNK